MRLFLSRWVCLDVASNLRRLPEEAAEGVKGGAEVVVFPESFLHGYKQAVDPARVRGLFHEISAAHPGTLFCFGSYSEDRRNRMTLWQGGSETARYDKVHLFAPNGEFDIWQPGDHYVAVKALGWTWGLINCNDIRFPEQARALRLQARCDALLTVAWWPWRRNHIWETLLRARAIENAAFTIGCCLSACETDAERFSGAGNYVFDPLGDPVPATDDRFFDLDPQRREKVIIDPLETFVDIPRVVTLP